jgi:hypothetical protein
VSGLHALQANRSVRHGTCFHRRLSARHAGAAPHSAVAWGRSVTLPHFPKHHAMNSKTHTVLLLICIVLLVVIAVGVWTRPSLEDINKRIMHWGVHFSAPHLNK